MLDVMIISALFVVMMGLGILVGNMKHQYPDE